MATATVDRPDKQIQQDVVDELRWDALVQSTEIGVAVTDGVVALTGSVDTLIKKWAAERAAQRVRGVKVVVNDVEVQLPGSAMDRGDGEIASAVTGALAWDASIAGQDVEVMVSGGWVTLQGRVAWPYQKKAAEQIVGRLVGVRGVTNVISVRPHVAPAREELWRMIRDALLRNAETDAERIIVDVQGTKVVLHGTVRSWAPKREAERTACSAPGVSSVENHIIVSL